MRTYAFISIIIVTCLTANAQEAQFRGPDRNGIYPATGLLKKWPADGPEMILKTEGIGMGYSSPIWYNGIIYVTGTKDDADYLTAINMGGNILYQAKYGKPWNETYPEARCTPTLDNGRLYMVTGIGQVVCMNALDGSIVWSVDAMDKYKGEVHRWGIAESPLVIDNKVIYTTGGDEASVVAFDKMTGEEAWLAKSLGGSRTYVSPVIYRNGDHQYIIAVTAYDVLCIEPGDGTIIWNYRYLPDEGPSARGATNSTNSPVIRGNDLFISKGYDQYGVMLEISPDGRTVKEKWRSSVLDTHHGHYVYVGDYLYGSNWINNSKGNWVCLDWDTGKVMYEETWITKGPIVAADGLLYCCEERSGNVALVKPTPERFDIISSFKIKEGMGPYWVHPYIVDGKMLMRHGDVLMVFDIRDKS